MVLLLTGVIDRQLSHLIGEVLKRSFRVVVIGTGLMKIKGLGEAVVNCDSVR